MFDIITAIPEIPEIFDSLSIHHMMLSDEIRMKALSDAIRSAVKPGYKVADIGAGTGILSFLSVKAGASKVYAIEKNNTIELAKQISKRNRFGDKIEFIKSDSKEIDLPEKVDVIISETIGHMGLGEDFLSNIIDARNRFLKPKGVLMPKALSIYMVPSKSKEIYEYNELWSNIYWIDYSTIKSYAENNIYVLSCNDKDFISKPQRIIKIDLQKMEKPEFCVKAKFHVDNDAVLYGLAGWFSIGLIDGISIKTSPLHPSTHWKQCFLPIKNKIMVTENEQILLKVNLNYPGKLSCLEISCLVADYKESLKMDLRGA